MITIYNPKTADDLLPLFDLYVKELKTLYRNSTGKDPEGAWYEHEDQELPDSSPIYAILCWAILKALLKAFPAIEQWVHEESAVRLTRTLLGIG